MGIDQTFSDRVWRGDRATIDEAWEKYQQGGNLLPCASVLYSFRHVSRARKKLLSLAKPLRERAEFHIGQIGSKTEFNSLPDLLDMISSYVIWLGDRVPSYPERLSLRRLAWEAATRGERLLIRHYNFPYNLHTRLLLLLTQVQLLITEELYSEAWVRLREAGGLARDIADANQKARVYRKLGMLYRRAGFSNGRPFRMCYGFWWIIRAIFVRGIPLNNRLKSVAALLGITS